MHRLLRAHLYLTGCVILLTTLVVLLGRRSIEQVEKLAIAASPTLFARESPATEGEKATVQLATTRAMEVRPIPFPEGDPGLRRRMPPRSSPWGAREASLQGVLIAIPDREQPAIDRPIVPAQPSPPTAATSPQPTLLLHRIVEGESLPGLAARYLGVADRWPELFELNRDILADPEILPLGVYLRVPERWKPIEASAKPSGP